jgi:hypothetical protein
MAYVGFSTGALAFGDFAKAIEIMSNSNVNAIELSGLRRHELEPLVNSINDIDLSHFKYVSVHAPSKIAVDDEPKVIRLLETFAEREWPIVVHPDAIASFERWRIFGNLLLVENMDKRKSIGRTYKELVAIFDRLPNARFCFDIAHARQYDQTMREARLMLQNLSTLITQIHISGGEENNFKHTRISQQAMRDYKTVAAYVPQDVAIILESVIDHSDIEMELKTAQVSLWDAAANSEYRFKLSRS